MRLVTCAAALIGSSAGDQTAYAPSGPVPYPYMPCCASLWRGAILLLVWSTGALAQSGLSIIPQELSLIASAIPSSTASETITVVSRGPELQFNASVRYSGPESGWLSVSPASGKTPALLTVTADSAGLAPGTYLGQVIISGGGIGTTMNVYFTVGSGVGTLVADPTGLTFLGNFNSAVLPAQTLNVTIPNGTGASGFRAIATSSGNWLTVTPFPTAAPTTLIVSAIQSGLPAGNHYGTITLLPLAGGSPTVVPVALSASGAGSSSDAIRLSQSSLTITHQAGTSVPPAQSLRVSTTVGERVYTASTSTPWMRLTSPFNPTPTSSLTEVAPSNLSVYVDPTGLVPGSYAGMVEIASTGLTTQQLPVTLTITTTPALNVQPSSLSFDDSSGSEATVTVTATGSANLTFNATASSSGTWLTVTPVTGSTASGAQAITIRVQRSGLPVGTHNGSVTLTVPGTTLSVRIPVRVVVTVSSTTLTLLDIFPEALDLTSLAGDPLPSGRITVNNIDYLTAVASSTTGWLAIEPFSGPSPSTLVVKIRPEALTGPGTYTGNVILTSLITTYPRTVPVTFRLATQAIAVEPASLSFVQERRGTDPPAQRMEVRTNVPSDFAFIEFPPWVKLDPVRGRAPANVKVWVEMALVPPGTNGGTIRIAGPNNEITVPVSVTQAPPPRPTVNPEAITFTHQVGDPAPITRAISLGSTYDTVTFTATAATESGVNWLSVSPAAGTTPAEIKATVNSLLLVPGRQTGSITIRGSDGDPPLVIPVTVDVSNAKATLGSILHAATGSPTAISPGQVVALTGAGLGPAVGITARPSAAGAYETRLNDTQVLFDGSPAPLLYVRHDQINAIVPYSMFGRLSARVQVVIGSGYSLPVEAKVVDAAPGIFTIGSSGRGPAAALNVDYTSNSVTNPAQRGSIISVFGTGEGQTDPPGQDGRIIASDLRRPVVPVIARIGGRPAEVTYAGSASGMVSGIFQVNIRVPDDIASGSVPVELQFGNAVTQPGVTIAVQ